jgi:hypothetical protein
MNKKETLLFLYWKLPIFRWINLIVFFFYMSPLVVSKPIFRTNWQHEFGHASPIPFKRALEMTWPSKPQLCSRFVALPFVMFHVSNLQMFIPLWIFYVAHISTIPCSPCWYSFSNMNIIQFGHDLSLQILFYIFFKIFNSKNKFWEFWECFSLIAPMLFISFR